MSVDLIPIGNHKIQYANRRFNEVGIELRVARIRKDLKMREVCKLTGLGLNCVSDAETGKRNTGILILKRIADVLGVSVTDFLFL